MAVAFTSEGTADGLTVPRAGRAAHWAGDDHPWADAEQVRFEITSLRRSSRARVDRRPAAGW